MTALIPFTHRVSESKKKSENGGTKKGYYRDAGVVRSSRSPWKSGERTEKRDRRQQRGRADM